MSVTHPVVKLIKNVCLSRYSEHRQTDDGRVKGRTSVALKLCFKTVVFRGLQACLFLK